MIVFADVMKESEMVKLLWITQLDLLSQSQAFLHRGVGRTSDTHRGKGSSVTMESGD